MEEKELYRKLYFTMFNGVTDALDAIDAQNFGVAGEILRKSQQDAEELYLVYGDVSPSSELLSKEEKQPTAQAVFSCPCGAIHLEFPGADSPCQGEMSSEARQRG